MSELEPVQKPRTCRIAIPEPTSTMPDYNARCLPQYVRALEAVGAIAVVVDVKASQSTIAGVLATCSGILLPGSPADVNPQKYGHEPVPECAPADSAREAADELFLQDAFNLQKPILGICYGMQSLNVWRGGTLIQHLSRGAHHDAGPEVLAAHEVILSEGTRLREVLADASDVEYRRSAPYVVTNSSHHQAVQTPGDDLVTAARAGGDGICEAIAAQSSQHWVIGVQWHPERSFRESPASEALFRAFVEAVQRRGPRDDRESVER